jgi:hypothetical protein
VFVSPFGPLEGGTFAETHFYLLSSVGLSIPCEIRADVVGGLINIAVRLIPSAVFNLDTHISSEGVSPNVELHKKAELDLTMEVEGCIDVLITEACVEAEIPILEDVALIDETGADPRDDLVTCDGSGAGGGEDLLGGGAGITHELDYRSISAPVVTHSPDGASHLECRFDQDGFTQIDVDGGPVEGPVSGLSEGDFMNPAAAFVANTAALIAWTDADCEASGLGVPCNPDSGKRPEERGEDALEDYPQSRREKQVLCLREGREVRPRANSKPVCSGCFRRGPGYDRLPVRRFEFVPLNLARCFRCQKNFNPIDFVMIDRRCDFLLAVAYLERLRRSSE